MDYNPNSALEVLGSFAELQSVPDQEILWLLENSKFQTLLAGEFLFEPEKPIDWLFFILEGKIELFILEGETKQILAQYEKGGILGFLPFSRDQKSSLYGLAVLPTDLLAFPKSNMQQLIENNPELTAELVQLMIYRAHIFSVQSLQNEKLLTLGKLSAGLTHELNNPITSIQRDSAELNRLFLSDNLSDLGGSFPGLDSEEKSKLLEAIHHWQHASRITGMSSQEIQKTEIDWMEKLRAWGMKNPEEAAEVFTDFGVDPAEIHRWITKMNPDKVNVWLNWIQFLLQSQALILNLKNATERVTRLIGAVKSFTHVEQNPIQTHLDLVKGIEDTLAILAHKLKTSKVEVIFHKPEDAVTIFGIAGELNQVWTNLIDNAIDAMKGVKSPKLEIKVITTESSIGVEVTDNGCGIPEEIKQKIFDPFFTTKGMGKGTGIGLDLVNQIVKKHRGTIQVDSLPGKTTFNVEFPSTSERGVFLEKK